MVFTVPQLGDWMKKLKKIGTDDWIDRLNYYVTVWILLFLTMMISAKQYLGSPIQCWVPAQWKGGWEQYAEDYCFIKNTYSIPLYEELPDDIEVRRAKEIGYYQWVPIVLALQAFMFFFPNFVWMAFSWQSGLNVETILNRSKQLDKPEATAREISELTTYIQDSLGECDSRAYTLVTIGSACVASMVVEIESRGQSACSQCKRYR